VLRICLSRGDENGSLFNHCRAILTSEKPLGPLQGRSLAQCITLNRLCPETLRRQLLWGRALQSFSYVLVVANNRVLGVWACVYYTHQPADWWVPSSVVRLRASYEVARPGGKSRCLAKIKTIHSILQPMHRQIRYSTPSNNPNKENYSPRKEYSTPERARIYGLAQYAVATGNLLLNDLSLTPFSLKLCAIFLPLV